MSKNGAYVPFFKKPSDYPSPAWFVGSSGASIFERRLRPVHDKDCRLERLC